MLGLDSRYVARGGFWTAPSPVAVCRGRPSPSVSRLICNPAVSVTQPLYRPFQSIETRLSSQRIRSLVLATMQSSSAPAGSRLLVVGPGVLGSYLGTLWIKSSGEGTVVGQTNTTSNHARCVLVWPCPHAVPLQTTTENNDMILSCLSFLALVVACSRLASQRAPRRRQQAAASASPMSCMRRLPQAVMTMPQMWLQRCGCGMAGNASSMPASVC
jgi:hypothetical protein